MKDQRKTEIRVGITVIFGIIIFLWILGWAKNFQLTTTDFELKITFSNVSGLQIGNDVTVNGVKKGFIKNYYINQNNVIVVVSLNKSVDLRSDAVFTIAMTDLMGGKKIEIYPGQSPESLDYKITHKGIFQADLASMMSALGGMESDFRVILEDVKISLDALNNYLVDEKISKDLRSTLSNLSDVSKKLNEMIDQNRQEMKEIVTNTKELTFQAKDFMDTNKESLNSSFTELNSILKKSDSLFTKFNYLVDETTSGQNNLGKIIYDDSLLVNLTQTMQQLNDLTKIILHQITTDGMKVDAKIF
jgi:phospholipid/cholesterol/gamma-HCH transport system substrate-binding protein